MFPLYDDAPRYSTPYINYFLLALNVVIFVFTAAAGEQAFVNVFGLHPNLVTGFLHGVPGISFVAAFVPFLTSMFLHASWGHLIFNMWALYIFGDNVEDYIGHARYLLFYLSAGIAGSVLHVFMNPYINLPSVGASGAIAGVMGAYFILYPSARVLTWVFFIVFVWLPAWVVLGFWFVGQFLSGAATAIATTSQTKGGGGIAFWAHVGGFVAGLGLIKLFPTRPRRYRYFTR